jgi:1,2-diacylglycerol 3-alpha-glucosyltransferase
MKIAFFTNNYLPYVSGVGSSIENFRLELEKRGHSVYVLAPSFDKKIEKADDKKIIRYPSFQTKVKVSFPVALLPSFKIDKLIRKINPDIFHAHHPFWLGNEALQHSKKLKKPLIFTAHTKFEHYVHYVPFLPSKILAKILVKRRSLFANKCLAVIAPTEIIKRELIKEGVKKPIYVVQSGIKLNNFKKANGEKIRKKHGISPQEKVLLFLGRLEKEKNLDLLLKIIPSIVNKYPLAKFLIVGDGFEKKKFNILEKKYPQRVICPGRVDYKEAPSYYKAADIFVQPSLSETQGLNTMEAMIAESAIIVANSKVINGFIKNGKNGLLVKANVKSFLKAISLLLDDPDYLLKFKKEAGRIAEAVNTEKCTEDLLKVYNKAIDASSKNF